MKAYFTLQFKRLKHSLSLGGLHPLVGFLLIASGAFLGIFLLYSKFTQAPFLLLIVAVLFLQPLQDSNKRLFLEALFSKKRTLTLLWIENSFIVLPLFVAFFYYQNWLQIPILLLLNGLIIFTATSKQNRPILPRFFPKHSILFTVGFRKLWWGIPLAVLFVGISYFAHNYSLAIGTFVLNFLILLPLFSNPEHESYVWNFALTRKAFLQLQLKSNAQQVAFLSVVPTAALLITFPAQWWISLLILLVFLLFTLLLTVIKYAVYPNEISIQEAVILAFSLSVFLILPLVFWWYYRKALQQITLLDHDTH